MKLGLIHIYIGNGKGKTTAALGLALRAAGQGMRVKIIQFLKGRSDYGEKKFIKQLANSNLIINIESYGRECFVDHKKLTKEDYLEAKKGLEKFKIEMNSKKYDLLILDEINVAIKFGLISVLDVLNLIKSKPIELELVLTGRDADKKLLQIGDYVTEFKEVKHPYKKGISARIGIEY